MGDVKNFDLDRRVIGDLLLMLALYWCYARALKGKSGSYGHVKTIDKCSRCAGFKSNLEKGPEYGSDNGNTRYLYQFLSASK